MSQSRSSFTFNLSRTTALSLAAVACALAASPLSASSAEMAAGSKRDVQASVYVPANSLEQFRPAAERNQDRIDFTYLDKALGWFVIPMGPSTRDGAGRVDPEIGTRRIYGHESRFRLEGNRVAFSYFTDDVRASLTEYRQDLERVGSTLDLTRLPRNEQLAFWLNLHNVAVIEALAYEYPLSQPSERKFGSNGAPLSDAKLVTVRGIELSPRDIRERIVYPNWRDPKVIYGFWRGEIGGPSIQRLAYSGGNLDALLALSGEEFVNSLRGVEGYGDRLLVSEIYREAAPFYFENDTALRSHLSAFAGEKVAKLITKTDETRYNIYARDVADLAKGERDPGYSEVTTQAGGSVGALGLSVGPGASTPRASRPNLAIQRLLEERRVKLNRAIKQGIRTGQVIYNDGEYNSGETGKEVE
ncbi:MAG: DUF547 domain-containing protein [Pseudomonadota bacterium]|nr:DUF547 domain-containing protein [Pseudomonadota bacterium]